MEVQVIDDKDKRMYESAIARGEECLETMGVLKFIKINEQKGN